MDDRALLQNFVVDRSEAAFAELVRRHVDLVYAAAIRQTGNESAAQDVTQTVFALLARKCRSIREGEALAGWLLVTTRFASLNHLRSEARRRRHEREAAAMKPESSVNNEAGWESVKPLLDDAITRLKREDRDAITLRFFKGQSLREVAAVMGTSEQAAQKRLSRALDRLREFFARKGVAATSEGLTSLLAMHTSIAAPAALSAQIVQQALVPTLAKTKGAVILMATAKTKVIAASAIVLVGISVPIVYHELHSVDVPTPAQITPSAPASLAPRDVLAGLYALQPDQQVRRIVEPFPPERLAYYQSLQPANASLPAPDAWVFKWDDHGLVGDGIRVAGAPLNVTSVLRMVLDIWPQDTDIPPAKLSQEVKGDWVVRAGASREQLIADVARMISDVVGEGMSLKPEMVERDVIVVRGTVNHTPSPDATPDERRFKTIRFFRGQWDKATGTAMGHPASSVLLSLGEMLRWPVVIETDLDSQALSGWSSNQSADFRSTDPASNEAVDELLANVMQQTGLELKRERRTVQTWRLTKVDVPEWQKRVNAAYALGSGQNVKRIMPPYIPERSQIFKNTPGVDGSFPTAIFEWDGLSANWRHAQGKDFVQVLKLVAEIWPQDTDIPRDLLSKPLDGDWVVRKGATQDQKLAEFCKSMGDVIGEGKVLKPEFMEREAIVVRGNIQFNSSTNPATQGNRLVLRETTGGGRSMIAAQTPREMLQLIGQMMARPVVIETEIGDQRQPYFITTDQSADYTRSPAIPDGVVVDEILARVAQQTNLQLRRERRTVLTWRLAPESP